MEIGAMTNPYKDLLPQIHWIGSHGFDYVDLAVEPPLARLSAIDRPEVLEAAGRYDLGIVVHTSPYLPLASRHRTIRRAAWAELAAAIALATDLRSPLVTLHYLGGPAFYTSEAVVDTYAELLDFLVSAAKGTHVAVALENSPANRDEVRLLHKILARVPNARLLLDIGHTNLHAETNTAAAFLNDPILGKRLCHMHLSDNNGAADLHLPPGSVRNGIDWPKMVRAIRRHPYDGRITLEVFSPDPAYLLISRDKLRQWWYGPESDRP